MSEGNDRRNRWTDSKEAMSTVVIKDADGRTVYAGENSGSKADAPVEDDQQGEPTGRAESKDSSQD